jgi:FkbM family methyltransferase
MSVLAAKVRGGIASTAVRRAGWPLPPRFVERVRDLAVGAMGVGSASLDIRTSGERRLLDQLASRWSERDVITVVDVGAYSGDYAVEARSAFGPKAHIHCLEPNQAMFPALRERVRGDARITCHPLALGRVAGVAPLYLDKPSSPRASLIEDTFSISGHCLRHSDEVVVTTLDAFAGAQGVAHIDLLKLDVEGGELAVLQGAGELLAGNGIEVIQFEFGERNLSSRTYLGDFFDLLGDAYEFFRLTPRGVVQFEYGPQHEIFVRETNYVAIARPRSLASDPNSR